MEVCHKEPFLQSAAAQELVEFMEARRMQWEKASAGSAMKDLAGFEEGLHERVMALECALIGEELGRYDVTAAVIEVTGKAYRRGSQQTERYLTAAGPVCVAHHLYTDVGEEEQTLCLLEIGSGISRSYFTRRARGRL